jgi:hypothetical protein
MWVQPHGFSIDCDAGAKIEVFGEIVIVGMDFHDVALFEPCFGLPMIA